MPAAVVAAIITGAVTATTTAYVVNKQGDAADKQAAANKEAQDAQDKAAKETLDFTKRQADLEQQNYIIKSKADYEQYAARERRLAPYRGYGQASLESLGAQMGLEPSDIPPPPPAPEFVPSNYSGDQTSPSGSSSGPGPSIDASKGDIGQQVSAYFKSRGVSDSETPYWVQKWSEFGQKDPAYFNQRLAAADIFGKSGAPGSSQPKTLSTMTQPTSSGQSQPIMLASPIRGIPIAGNPNGDTLSSITRAYQQKFATGNQQDGYDPNGPSYA